MSAQQERWECPICHDDDPTTTSTAKPCNHKFDKPCIENWIAHLQSQPQSQPQDDEEKVDPTCPVCRGNIQQLQHADGSTTDVNVPLTEEQYREALRALNLRLVELGQEGIRLAGPDLSELVTQERLRMNYELSWEVSARIRRLVRRQRGGGAR